MSDTNKTPAQTPEGAESERHVAKKGVEDRGHSVGTAADQPVDGIIADLADGDAYKHKHKK